MNAAHSSMAEMFASEWVAACKDGAGQRKSTFWATGKRAGRLLLAEVREAIADMRDDEIVVVEQTDLRLCIVCTARPDDVYSMAWTCAPQ